MRIHCGCIGLNLFFFAGTALTLLISTFGNLESTTEWLEIVFNIITITGGLILVTMLIGNIKVCSN